MAEFRLRDPYPTETIDPLTIAPDPGPMGSLYIGAREAYQDGMTLATATPLRPYQEIIEDYTAQCNEPGFSNVDFFDKNFVVEPSLDEDLAALPNEEIDDYITRIREKFVYSNQNQGYFDIWLPYDRAVAGAGRFGRHSFLWDGYQMAKGYAADERWDLVSNILDNTEYEIFTFGHPLNGSAKFYVTRAQPDYFAHEVRMLADRFGPEVLTRYLAAMEKNHLGYWMDGMDKLAALPLDGQAHAYRSLVRMPDGTFLNRYWDDADGPRLESYKEDVEEGELAVAGLSGAIREARLQKFYKDKRAGAASGWDYSSRWFQDPHNPLTINTTDIAPVDLQSLMAYNEETLAMAYEAAAAAGGHAGMSAEECLERAARYRLMRESRVRAMNTYNWDPVDKIYRDYNFVDRHQTSVISAAMTYPLYVGIATMEQALGVADAVEKDLAYEGGIIATTTERSTQQWDGGERGGTRSKNVWAPPNWAAVRGFARTAHILKASEVEVNDSDIERLLGLSERIKASYMHGIEAAFKEHGIIPEKHRGDNPARLADGGEYELVKVLAMPSETYRAMQHLNPRDPTDHLPR